MLVTGFWPTHVNKIKSAINNQKQILKTGLKLVFQISDVFINGTTNKIKIEPPIAKIPPVFEGIDLKIA